MSICTKHQEINIKYFPLVLFLCLKPVKQRPTENASSVCLHTQVKTIQQDNHKLDILNEHH